VSAAEALARHSILYVVHAMPPEEETGVPLVALGYVQEFARRGWDVSVIYGSNEVRDWESVRPQRWKDEGFVRIAVPTGPIVGSLWALSAPSVPIVANAQPNVTFERILKELRPDVLHVVDNVNLPLDWPERAKARHVPVIRTVYCAEDLCAFIAPVSPISDAVGYCLPPLTPQRCAGCVANSAESSHVSSALSSPTSDGSSQAQHTMLTDFLNRKRARSTDQFDSVFDRIVFPSSGFRSYFERTLPLNPARVRVISLGMDAPKIHGPRREERDPQRRVVFGFAGTLYEAKGIDTLVATFLHPALRERDDFGLEFFGGGNEELIEELLAINPNAHWHGSYRLHELPSLLEKIDVGLSTSRFETFHRVTREYLLAGAPVIGSRAFGIPEVIEDGVNGLLFDHTEPESMLRAVLSCLDDRDLLTRITQGAQNTAIKSVQEEADQLEALYRECL
jgi:glycosyltransferase involved in cell wall biosynthesis